MIEIIPAIDLIDGKCVRLTKGDYQTQKIYSQHPLDVAKEFEYLGIKRLHLVDLDGAKTNAPQNLKVLESIASKTKLSIDFGGGIKSECILQDVFNSGADFASIGSMAVKQTELFISCLEKYREKIILNADVNGLSLASNGWQENSNQNIFDFLKKLVKIGLSNVLCTDIAKDGMLEGPNNSLYKKINETFPEINLIASGGVSCANDILKLNELEIYGVVVGKAIYEKRIDLTKLMNKIEPLC